MYLLTNLLLGPKVTFILIAPTSKVTINLPTTKTIIKNYVGR